MSMGLGSVSGVLHELSVEESTIREILTILETGADDLHGGHPGQVNPVAFGGSSSGADFGDNVEIAHRHVIEAMEQMVAGLRGYGSNVRRFRDDVVFADEDAVARNTKTAGRVQATPNLTVAQSSNCIDRRDLASNDSCAVPAVAG